MKIKTISYKRTKNLGNYENEVLELTAELEDWENPDDAILSLQDRVNLNLGLKEAVQNLQKNRDELLGQLEDLYKERQVAQEKWEKIKAFLERLNIPVETVVGDDDIPF